MIKKFSLLTLIVSTSMLSACGTPSTPTPTDTMTSSSSSSVAQNGVPSWDGKVLSGKHTATIRTSKGDIQVELDADLAPKTVTNFLGLAASGYYNNITFHRVIPGFMIQGGDPSGNGTGGRSIYGEMFEDEIDPSNAVYASGYKAGAIAMANRGPDTNGSQFFLMDSDYPLPPNYTIFGRVTQGQDTVNTIARVPRGPNDMPNEPVTFSVVDAK